MTPTTPALLLSLPLFLALALPVYPAPAPSLPSRNDARLAKHIETFQAASAPDDIPSNIPDMSDLLPASTPGAEIQTPRLAPLPPLPAPATVADHGDEWYYPDDEADEAVPVRVIVKGRGEREAAGPPRPTGAARPMPKRVVELKGTVVVGRPRTRTGRERSRPTLRMEVPGDEE